VPLDARPTHSPAPSGVTRAEPAPVRAHGDRSAWRGWRAAAIGVLALGVAMRVNNAIRYRTGNGFDAVENVEYIRMLTGSWTLPAPDAAWATAHPPFFYYASAALWRMLGGLGLGGASLDAVPLAVSAAGLAAIAAGWLLVRRLEPADASRAWLGAVLLVFMPVHVYMAAMVSEELVVAMWTSWAVVAAVPLLDGARAPGARAGLQPGRAALVGVLAGLALLTKLTGALVVAAIGFAWLVGGFRSGRSRRALVHCTLLGGVALAVGGWYYLRNVWLYGYLYPQDLAVHAKMFDMPPGSRSVLDYLRVPLATFTDPQLLAPGLLHSVWGSTYDTVWFDGHRHFLARATAVTRMGTVITLLALVPTSAFVVGLAGGVRRALARPGGVDTLLVALTGLTLAGYVAFTWSNPWYVTVKGSYLLGLTVPFAVYASGTLRGWTRAAGVRGWSVRGALAALLLAVVVTFTIGPVFVKLDGPGLPWRQAVQ
jgi:hypothetical protein